MHANRTLRKLRVEGLIATDKGMVTVLDPPGLKRAAHFNGDYLHLDRVQHGDAVREPAGDLV